MSSKLLSPLSRDNKLFSFDFLKYKYDPNYRLIHEPTIHNQLIIQTKRINDQKDVIIKRISTSESEIYSELKNELEALNSIQHPSVGIYLDLYFFEKDFKSYEIVYISEKFDLNLLDMITYLDYATPKKEEELMQIFSDIASALYHCHGLNLPHCNIDPSNIILIHGPERPKTAQNYHVILKNNLYKLIDWKYSFMINNEPKQYQRIKPFSAPECYYYKLFNENEYKSMDVYALGMCMLNFCGVSLKKIQPISLSIQEIHDLQLEKIFKEQPMKEYNWHLIEILKGMLKYNINERLSIEHVWISLKALTKTENGGKSMDFEEKSSDSILLKNGVLKRFLSKFSGKDNDKKDNSQNSDNDSAVPTKFLFKLNTKNILINIVSKEDYKSFSNVKPTKNYKFFFEYFIIFNSYKHFLIF